VVVGVWACHAAAPGRPAGESRRTEAVGSGQVRQRVLLTGELRAASAIDLSVPRTETWQLSIRWLAEDGTSVKAGDRVLEFDNSTFADQLEQKHLALLDAEMTLKSTRDVSALELANKATELHVHQIELAKATVKAGVPADLLTARDAQDRQLEKKRAQVAVQKAEQDLAASKTATELELRVKQIAVDKAKLAIEAASESIRALVLTAPRDGVLVVGTHPWLGRQFHVGDTVQPGMAVVTLPDLHSGLEVRAQLSDVDDGRVAVGDQGTCTLDAYAARQLPCMVRQITPVARAESGGGSLRRAFQVVLSVSTTDVERMRSGMSAKVELAHAVGPAGPVVSRGAVARDAQGAHVTLESGESRNLELGSCDEQVCAVARGLAVGERVRLGGNP
jgi:multidrug resistance efflux pump